MFVKKVPSFSSEENETEFLNVCESLRLRKSDSSGLFFKMRSSQSPHQINSDQSNNEDEVVEVTFPEIRDHVIEMEHDHVDITKSKNRTDIQIDKVKIFQLRELLMNCQDGLLSQHDPEIFNVLTNISSEQVPLLCELLEMSLLGDGAVAVLLESVKSLEKPIGLATAMALMQHAVYPKIQILKQDASRILVTSVLNFSEVHPKAVINEILIPCLNEESFNTSHSELVLKLARHHIPNEQISYCLKEILKSGQPSQNVFCTIQALIERKVTHDDDVFDMLIWKFHTWPASNNSDLKFTKLIISILTIYGSQLSSENILLCSEIVQGNKTLLKKAAESLLKKLVQDPVQ